MKRFPNWTYTLAVLVALLSAKTAKADPQSFAGQWDATLTLNGTVIPFRLDVSGKDVNLTGTLYNGYLKQTTTSAKFEKGKLVLSFDQYLTSIVAAEEHGKLTGSVQGRFETERYLPNYPFAASRHVDTAAAPASARRRVRG